eukprot:7849773-Pyramimonas_sp.AAC.1
MARQKGHIPTRHGVARHVAAQPPGRYHHHWHPQHCHCRLPKAYARAVLYPIPGLWVDRDVMTLFSGFSQGSVPG